MKIALAQINPTVGSLHQNCTKILANIEKARALGASIVLFPEMALTGYPPEDLLFLPSFVVACQEELKTIIEKCRDITAIVGTVREGERKLYNTAAIIEDGELIGFQDKTLLPNYDVFSEPRYFESTKRCDVWSLQGKRVAITICEDIWEEQALPIEGLAKQAPDLLLNLSASPYSMERHHTRLEVCQKTAKRLQCPVLYCNQVGGNDRLIFDGFSLHVGGKGELLHHAKGFEEDLLFVDLEKKTAPCALPKETIAELFQALVLGVRDYFHKLGFSQACFGLSGGIDSAVVAVIAKEALGKENLHMLALPSRYSTQEGMGDAQQLARNLAVALTEISIETPFQAFLDTLAPHFVDKKPDVTEENLQARIRANLLMAFSNKMGYLLLSTGNKSEMAMGYATLYGDMCGGLGVLSDVTKEQVYALARWINREREIIPQNVLEKPPSAELREGQKDSDTLPNYPIVDAVLTDYVEEHLSPEEIAKKHQLSLPLVQELVRKIHLNEYKRQQAPPGLRVTKKSFTVGRRFPIVQHWNM